MSGGSYNYMYSRIEDEYAGKMHDSQLNEMMVDLCELLHDLEWWQSCDCSEKLTENLLLNSKRSGSSKRRLMCKNISNQSLKEQRMSY